MSRYQVVLRHKWEESAPAQGVSGVAGDDIYVLQALAYLDIFGAGVLVSLTYDMVLVFQGPFHKPVKGLPGKDITSSTAHVTLTDIRLEFAAKVYGLTWFVWLQHVSKVLHHYKGVIIGFHKPICLVPETVKKSFSMRNDEILIQSMQFDKYKIVSG